jgi:uncharacterized repeat protein (TIGR03803 family)
MSRLRYLLLFSVILTTPAFAGEVVLHQFTPPAKGATPFAGVIGDSSGNLYGTTESGGQANKGVVYKLDHTGHETVLYSFTGLSDGCYPYGGVIRDSAGNLYGTTAQCGNGEGLVFKIDTTGHETVLYTFTGGLDGGSPWAGVISDSSGNLYGTTFYGGSADAGVVFRVDTGGHETVLYNFTGGFDGKSPQAGVVLDSAGNLYGTTYSGGTANAGVVYKLDSGGRETVLHSFTGGTDGASPWAGVIRDTAGNIYGTT